MIVSEGQKSIVDTIHSLAVERWLLKQLQEIAPGKYVLAPILQRLKAGLRNPECRHLKGGRTLMAFAKDYNISVFRFADGVTEIKCLYNCGLKLRSDSANKADFAELLDIAQDSTNTVASSEISTKRNDPGPVPTYTDEDRARIQERERRFWDWAKANPEEYRKECDNVDYNHPNPIEAPESIIPGQFLNIMSHRLAEKIKQRLLPKATVTFQDEGVPALEPVNGSRHIAGRVGAKISSAKRKARKTQSRKSRKK